MGFGLRGGRINKKRPPISRRLFWGNLKDLYQPGCRGQAQGLRLSARPAGSLRGSSSFDQEVPGASSSPPGCWFVERYAINTWWRHRRVKDWHWRADILETRRRGRGYVGEV